MTARARPAKVEVGQQWTRRDPGGDRVIAFEVVGFVISPFGGQAVQGRTANGKIIQASPKQMLIEGGRFTFVSDERVRRQA